VRRAALVVLFVAHAAFAQVDNPDVLVYRVHQGDTLEVVGAEYYGDKNLANFIVTENKLLEPKQPKPRALRPGERLRIPVTREVATAKGDGFESLAQTYLGDSKRAQFLADFNGISIEDNLPTGTIVAIPAHVTHTASSGESFGMIAQYYFGDAKLGDMLKRYNASDKVGLDKGESIVVPLLRARSTKISPLDADGKERHDKQKKAGADAATALPRARSAWMVGDFDGVKSALGPVAEEADFLDAASAVEIGILLGKAHVAFDEQDAAVAAFAQVIDRKPRTTLAPYKDSPKVLAAWRKAGGHVEGE
jgi:LysM repeat protein